MNTDNGSECLLVICNLPNLGNAQQLAEHLVSTGLAACVNIQPACKSVYRWEGKIEQSNEVPVFIKTTRARYAELETAIRVLHPYEVPEIIALPISAGLTAYLQWVRTETEAQCNVC